jgi:hypothetical protein
VIEEIVRAMPAGNARCLCTTLQSFALAQTSRSPPATRRSGWGGEPMDDQRLPVVRLVSLTTAVGTARASPT